MTEFSLTDVEHAIDVTCDTIIRNEKYFADLDGLAGDGDFGISLATGFKVIKKDLPELDKSSVGAMLLKISMICSKHIGGSSGPIWGTGFMKAAMLTREKHSVTLADVTDMLGNAVDGIMQRGGAQRGDKTLIDALIPVHEVLVANANTDNPKAVLAAAADAADKAIDETRSLVAHRGRASQVGERSANTPDPGIVAIATILQDWCTEYGVDRTPKAEELAKAAA